MSVDDIARQITDEILAEEAARKRIAAEPDAPIGTDAYLLRMLLSALDSMRAALTEYQAADPL